MSATDYVTTGEAARMLNISRSTVSRKFDQGQLRGKTNPITGERMISCASLHALMKQYSLPGSDAVAPVQTILVCSPHEGLRSFVAMAVEGDDRVRMEETGSGCDALVKCARTRYGLLLIDDSISDIALPALVSAVRKGAQGEELPIAGWCTGEHPELLQASGVNTAIYAEPDDNEGLRTQLYQQMGLEPGMPCTARDYQHERQWPRADVAIPMQLAMYRLRAPRAQTPGRAVMIDVSCGGARLKDINLDEGGFPVEPFRLLLKVDDERLPAWRAHAQVVGLRVTGGVTAAVQFIKISKPNLEKVRLLVAAEGGGNY